MMITKMMPTMKEEAVVALVRRATARKPRFVSRLMAALCGAFARVKE